MIKKASFIKALEKFLICPVRTVMVFIALLCGAFPAHAVTVTYTNSTTWTAPANVYSVTVEAWGGGGGGGGQDSTSDGGGGGGGGAYANSTLNVVPGTNYTVTIGARGNGGVGGCGTAGGDSWFLNNSTVLAQGGQPGCDAPTTPPPGGAGGSAAASIGTTTFSGGNGGRGRNSNTGRGGPGGSSAGTAANGTSAPDTWSTLNAGAAPAGGGIGGNGGDVGIDGATPGSGNGGGGGGSGEGRPQQGGNGTVGKIILTYTVATAPTVTTNVATAVTVSGATLNGSVSSNNASTTVTFDYGLTTGYGSSVTATASPLGAGAVNTAVAANLTGLACSTTYNFRVKGVNGVGTTNGANRTFTTSVCPPPPNVVSINTTSVNPTSANTSVTWAVVFDSSVTGVDLTDFEILEAGGATGSSLSSVTGSGTTYTVTANTGTGFTGALLLRLEDDDSIINATSAPLGGVGASNGNFTGQSYTLVIPDCEPGVLFCDNFERSVYSGGSNTADAVGTAPGFGAWTVGTLGAACDGVAGNRGCAGIDSDIPPFSTASSPRANSTRALFTRWTSTIVTSPVINLSGKTGVRLTFWVRRGSDCFSEWPGNSSAGCNVSPGTYSPVAGEEFQVQYKNNLGNWLVLAQFATDDTPGEIMMPVIDLPDDAMYAGFQFRFSQPGGSGSGSTTGGAPGIRGYDYWHVDNVVVKEIPAVEIVGPFCDTFEGDLLRWSMLGTGNIRIGSTPGFQANGIQNMDLRWNTVSATSRKADLSADSGNNIISFWVRRGTGNITTAPNNTGSEYPETAGKGLKFEYLNNVGTWVQLGSAFVGGGTQGQIFLPSAGTNNFPIPANAKHNNFKMRISMLAGAGLFDQDYWHVDNVCVGTGLASTDISLSMTSSGTFSPWEYIAYTLVATNNGPSADPGPINIRDTLPAGLSFIGASAGWTCSVAGQLVSCSQLSGLAVGASTALTITALIDGAASGTVTNTAIVGGQTIDTAQANNTASQTDTIFVPGYVFTDRLCNLSGSPIGSGSQCSEVVWSQQKAGTPKGGVYITKVNSFKVPVQLSGSSSTTVNMQFALSCIDPVSNAGVQATFYDATTTTLPLCQANGATPSTWTASRALSFPAATPSVGPFSFNYNDVGNIGLYMRDSAATSVMGRSIFVVRPAGFVLSGIKCTTANAANCGAGALAMTPSGTNPAATTAGGATFIRAGHPFSVTVRAVNSLGNATPNYGKEKVPESVKLTNALVPSLGMNFNPLITCADLTNATTCVTATATPRFGAFASGIAEGVNFAWNDVGIITLTPSVFDGNYLGAGDVIGTTSGNIGRFFPHRFNTQVTAAGTMGCQPPLPPTADDCPAVSGMVYSGQPFTPTVSARNASGGLTQNYETGSFAKAVTLSPVNSVGGAAIPAGAPGGTFTAGATIAAVSFAGGSATTGTPAFSFAAVPSDPLKVYVRAIDSDNVSSLVAVPANSIEGGVKVASGRIKMSNAHGSEFLPLPIAATVLFFNGSNWVTSATDNVTSLTLAANYSIMKGGLSTGSTTTPTPTGVNTVSNGLLNIRLSKPSAGHAGSAMINPTVSVYLPMLPAAGGQATFGVYRGADEFIYLRENY